MDGNLCKFLAMDFDSHSSTNQTVWKDDILAIHKTFSDVGINSYIEISRSGNSGHLWIFFEETISAIDEKILWYGNINFLGYTENEECCMRIVDNKIASEIEAEVLGSSTQPSDI